MKIRASHWAKAASRRLLSLWIMDNFTGHITNAWRNNDSKGETLHPRAIYYMWSDISCSLMFLKKLQTQNTPCVPLELLMKNNFRGMDYHKYLQPQNETVDTPRDPDTSYADWLFLNCSAGSISEPRFNTAVWSNETSISYQGEILSLRQSMVSLQWLDWK